MTGTNEAAEQLGAQTQISTVRILPGVGVRFADRDILDANILFSGVIDAESNASAYVQGGLGRELFGLYLGVDARRYFGRIPGLDGGGTLSYTFPRDWFPGLLMVRGSFRYFREDLPDNDLRRPVDIGDAEGIPVPVQESYQAFAGVEWRL